VPRDDGNAGEFLVNRTTIPPSATRSITRYRACISLADRVITSRGQSIDSLASVARTRHRRVRARHSDTDRCSVHRNVMFAVINAAAPRNAADGRSRCVRSRVSREMNVPSRMHRAERVSSLHSSAPRCEADCDPGVTSLLMYSSDRRPRCSPESR